MVNDLIENADYEFRVRAVNKAGESEPSATSGRVKITEFPDGIKPEFIKRLLDQEGPIGGSVSFRAEFEGKPTPVAKWFKNGIEIVPNNRYEIIPEQFSSIFTIKNLTDSDNHHSVTCTIVSPLGRESSEALIKIIAIPKLEKEPGDQTVNINDTLKIKIPIVGKGPFQLKLAREDDEEAPVDASAEPNFKVSEIDGTVTLILPSAQRNDTGNYTLTVSNDSGAIDVYFKLKVKAPPGPPQGPLEVSDIGKTHCTLSWKAPLDDGGNRVTHYLIEKRDCSKGKDVWIPYADHCKETSITVQSLNENSNYEFRVLAVNQNGVSEPLVTSTEVLVKLPYGVPDAPGEPEISEVGTNFVQLNWTKPASDGGGPITGYWVDKKEKDSDRWIRCNSNRIQTTSFNVPNLIENKEYEFRIFAENPAGLSQPSTCSKSVKIRDPNAATLPEFTAQLQDTEAVEGKQAVFECEINAHPAPVIRFYKGSKELYDSNKYRITQEGNKHILTIYNVQLEDQDDEYSVKAKNKGGSRMSRANLTVKCNLFCN